MELGSHRIVDRMVHPCVFDRSAKDRPSIDREGITEAFSGLLAQRTRRTHSGETPWLPSPPSDRHTQPGLAARGQSCGREVQPPPTDLLADWVDSWSRRSRGGRRRTGSALAIPAGTALGFVEFLLHRMGGLERGVQAHRPGRGRASMGRTEKQTQHELRQIVTGTQVLLRQEHNDKGPRETIRLQIRLPRTDDGLSGTGRSNFRSDVIVQRIGHELSSSSFPRSSHLLGWTVEHSASVGATSTTATPAATLLLALSILSAYITRDVPLL